MALLFQLYVLDRPNVEAYLGGVSDNSDMLVLDLFSETQPKWSNARVKSYYGKPWIWCQLHDYGGNMGLYGQIMNITINPVEALANASSPVGFELTMEGQEGNEIMYDLLLDQAWSGSPIDTETYFFNWVTCRYSGNGPIPSDLYTAWDMMRTTVYNNTNLITQAVTKSIFELSPNTTGMLGRTGHHATTVNYNPSTLTDTWHLMYAIANANPSLWDNAAYQYDTVDVTRQVFSNNFNDIYSSLISAYKAPSPSTNSTNSTVAALSQNLTTLLGTLDSVLLTNPSFSLSPWLTAARSQTSNTTLQSFFEYNARNQITLWGPDGEINDYGSKSWGGLVSGYYVPRWEIFGQYLTEVPIGKYNATVLSGKLLEFEKGWQNGTNVQRKAGIQGGLKSILGGVIGKIGP
jgi:alpha-N-acetylglucosaminidase